MNYLEKKHIGLYTGMLVNFIYLGLTFVVHGFPLPHILNEYGWSYAAAGAVLSGGVFLATKLGWRGLYMFTSVYGAVLLFAAFFLPFKTVEYEKKPETGSRDRKQKAGNSYFHPMLVLAVLSIFTFIGIGLSNWIGEYFVSILGATKGLASLTVSLFWFGILAGRVLIPLVAKKVELTAQLIIFSCLITVSVLFTASMNNPVAAVAGIILAGFGCSSVYPLVMTLVGQFFTGNQSIYLGAVSTGGGIGIFVFPMVMAVVADAVGLRTGFMFFGIISVL